MSDDLNPDSQQHPFRRNVPFKFYQQKRPSGSNPRPCRPQVVPFDTEKQAEMFIHFESLKNLETEEVPKPGDFMIKIFYMGQAYGHILSGNVNFQSLASYTRGDEKHQTGPDIFLDHDISFCVKFKDFVDHPLVLQLCRGGSLSGSGAESGSKFTPFAFICLDMGRILDYKTGKVEHYLEPWILPVKQGVLARVPVSDESCPLLQLTLECFGGLPDTSQLLQGNLMTVNCESLYNLPTQVQLNVGDKDNTTEAQIFVSLPYTQADATLKFPGGKYREGGTPESMFRRATIVEDATQTGPSMADVNGSQYLEGSPKGSTAIQGQPTKERQHWASVMEYSGEMPVEATVISEGISLDAGDPTNEGEHEIFGDGREDFLEYRETGEPRMVWNSVHKKYLSVDTYRSMLTRLSKNAVWPLEITIAVKRKPGLERAKKKAAGGNKAGGGNLETSSSAEDKMIMSELGVLSSSSNPELTLIFHGIAFVDLSCLVYPGMKSARFACKVLPFSNDLLKKRTCLLRSVVSEALLLTYSPKLSADKLNSKRTVTSGNKTNDLVSTTGKASLKSEVPVSMDGTAKVRASNNVRRSDVSVLETGVKKEEFANEGVIIERSPFIVFKVSMLRSIVPYYKSTDISKVVNEFLPKRQLARRKIINASTAQQNYRTAVLEAASEISHEFSEHYWKDVLQNGADSVDQSSSNPPCNETLKKGFLFYLNASGRYLILREHLRNAISTVVQQKCLNLRPSGFHNHRDFQSYLHDMYIYLVDEMNEVLSSTTLQETDPLKSNLDRLLQQTNCVPEEELSRANLHNRQITDLGIFAEESFAQGDFEACHKLHLQRICRDKESSRTWTEFAIMWLSRGDDRMAEISVKEALRKDPLHLYALLISGIISVRHGDERGLECLGAALGLFPMSPEILVIVGLSNSLIGNDIAADYFFRKAAYVHRIITGQSVEELDKYFSGKNTAFNMKRFTEDLDNGVNNDPEVYAEETVEVNPIVPISPVIAAADRKQSKPLSKRKRSSKKSQMEIGDMENEPKKLSQEQINRQKSNERTSQGSGFGESLAIAQANVATKGPTFSFTENLEDILPDEVNLPWLSPSIQSPHDMTVFSAKMEQHLLGLEYLQKNPNTKKAFQMEGLDKQAGSMQTEPDGNMSGSKIREDYDKFSNASGNASFVPDSEAGGKPSKKRNSDKKTVAETVQTRAMPEHVESVPQLTMPTLEPSKAPKLTDRLGSELIWTTSLLINLRLFDFVDGALAKHLYFYGTRSVQFIYLRALSLYLRQREQEALPLLKEAIALDNTDGTYHALEGHCYYMLGYSQNATASYERALKLPHTSENRHLLYLRYGSLLLDQSKSKIAKRVFLHGVGKYPTPYMWLALGSACFQRQEYDQAESAFAEANRLDSTNPIAWGHLSLSSLMQDKRALAEQSYKWAIRFGLKKGVLLDEIQKLQKEKGFGDPSFPRIPSCVPHEYYLRRMGRLKPFNIYKEALNQDPPGMARGRYEDTENEKLLKKKLAEVVEDDEGEAWDEDPYEMEMSPEASPIASEIMQEYSPFDNMDQQSGLSIPLSVSAFTKPNLQQVQSAPADVVKSTSGTFTTIKPPTSRTSQVVNPN